MARTARADKYSDKILSIVFMVGPVVPGLTQEPSISRI